MTKRDNGFLAVSERSRYTHPDYMDQSNPQEVLGITRESKIAVMPLYVDLDGSLILNDSFWESFFIALKGKPIIFFQIPVWLLQGIARVKQEVAAIAAMSGEAFIYRETVKRFLETEKHSGRQIILATAAHRTIADAVHVYFPVFSSVLASDGRRNLSGAAKLEAILEHAHGLPFAYLGNARSDLAIWKKSAVRYVVASARNVRKYEREISMTHTFIVPSISMRHWFHALRPWQWTKNLLLFLPLLLAHQWWRLDLFLMAIVAFVCFCLSASAVYIMNDLFDAHADRCHEEKKHRPFASCELSSVSGIGAAGFLLCGAAIIAFIISPKLFFLLLLYAFANGFYTLRWKSLAIVDIFVVTSFYVYRILVGAAVTGIALSAWLLAFSFFFFLSLVLLKRFIELRIRFGDVPSRGYVAADVPVVTVFGMAAGAISSLVLALYIQNPEIAHLYHRPGFLWLSVAALLFWMMRAWLLAHRGQLQSDPVEFALKDWTSRFIVCFVFIILVVAAV